MGTVFKPCLACIGNRGDPHAFHFVVGAQLRSSAIGLKPSLRSWHCAAKGVRMLRSPWYDACAASCVCARWQKKRFKCGVEYQTAKLGPLSGFFCMGWSVCFHNVDAQSYLLHHVADHLAVGLSVFITRYLQKSAWSVTHNSPCVVCTMFLTTSH